MKRKKIDWKKEVEILRQQQETDRLRRQYYERIIHERNEEIVALKEKVELEQANIKHLISMLLDYVSCFEKVREAVEDVENGKELTMPDEEHRCYVIELNDCDDDIDAIVEFIGNLLGDDDA